MKKALSCKILFILAIFAFSLALAFSFNGVKSVRADDITATNIESYFSGAEKFELTGNLVATVTGEKNQVKIEKELVVDDLAIELTVPADKIDKYSVTLKYKAFYGNEFDEEVSNEFSLAATGDVIIAIKTDNNVLSVNGVTKTVTVNDNVVNDVKYNIKGADKCAAYIAFKFDLKDGEQDAKITFKSINQKAGDGTNASTNKYIQTFTLDEDKKIANLATPRVSINDLPITKDASGKLNVIYGKYYKFSTIKTYSVFGDASLGSLYIKSADNWVDSTNVIAFKDNVNETTFTVSAKDGETEKDLEVYTALPAKAHDEDNTAPTYIEYNDNTKVVYEEYAKLVAKAAKDGDHSILLGESFEIPSLKGLVTDDYDVYSDLKYTVYYRTPSNASGSTSSLSFTVSEAGDYEFYVVFKDSNGNAMQKDDFYKIDEHDSNIKIIDGTTKYSNAVFTFTVNDDAPMSVTVPNSQGTGYLNIKYTATAFDIQSSGYNVTYTLFYNADVNATADSDGWVAVNSESEDFTESEIETIAYDDKYTFTPVKLGAYKIDCEITSDMSERSASGSTVIKVEEEPKIVKVDTHWLKNNIWSVVFLSVGTLALIGIIVLLFIKPKEEVETDETGDALKSKDNK